MRQSAWNPYDERLDQRRRLLVGIPMFEQCSKEVLDDLVQRAVGRTCPRDMVLHAQGEPAEALYFISRGRIRLLLSDEGGREFNLAHLGPGDFFGESALFEGRVHATTALALDEVVLLKLTREALLGHFQRHPLSAIRLAAELHRRMAAAQRTIAELAFNSVERRLVHTLERWAHSHGVTPTDEGLFLRARPTHQQLAQMTGSARETITRAFSSLEKRGLLIRRGTGMLLSQALLAGDAA